MLNRDTQNLIITEHLLGFVSTFQAGTDRLIVCPPEVAAAAEVDPNALTTWQQSYGSTDFASDLHAIAKVLEQLGLEDVELLQKPCTGTRLYPWEIVLVYEGRQLSGVADNLNDVPSLIALLCLQFAGAVL